jgi:hypothetical protein
MAVGSTAVFRLPHSSDSTTLWIGTKIVKPGGSLVFDLPREPEERKATVELDTMTYVRWYTKSEIVGLLMRNGCKVTQRTEIALGDAANPVLRTAYIAMRSA